MAVAPVVEAVATVVPPAVPTVAMTAVSRLAPVSIMMVCPAEKSATLATLMLGSPAARAIGRLVADWTRKSAQLLSVSAPSGRRPELLLLAPANPPPPRPPPPPPRPPPPAGAGAVQPL